MSQKNKGRIRFHFITLYNCSSIKDYKIWASGFSKESSLFLLGKLYLKSQRIRVIDERDEWLLWISKGIKHYDPL